MKFKVSATVPVTQYGNITPELEVEADTYEEAYALAMPKIEAFWNKYVEPGKQLKTAGQKIACFVGGSINYDPVSHTYTNDAGEVYLSGSQYAKQFEKPFERDKIAAAIAKKFNADPEAIKAMWELKAETSRGFGTAMHAAMELYGKYDGLAKSLDKQTNLHDHPVIKKAVEDFYKGREGETAKYEPFIVDHAAQRAGQVDRLLITDQVEGLLKCRIQDFKTNASIDKSLPGYWKQLEFYGWIIEAAGHYVEGYDIFHWDGTWKTISKERSDAPK